MSSCCMDCGRILNRRRNPNRFGIPLCKRCFLYRIKTPKFKCSECGTPLNRSYICTNITGRPLCISCVGKYQPPHSLRVTEKVCHDCGILLGRINRIKNKWGVFLCKQCSNFRKKKPRKHCEDCGKELNRSYNCQNRWGLDLCESCSVKRQHTLSNPRFGFKKGNVPLTKGFTKETSPIVAKISAKKIGQKVPWSEERRKNNAENCPRGEEHWNYGRQASAESRQKMSESHKGKHKGHIWVGKTHPWLGKNHTDVSKQKNSLAHIGKPSQKKGTRQLSTSGENNPAWNGGTSFEPYCHKFTKYLKEEVRERYERKCLNCGKTENDNIAPSKRKKKLAVHHVDYDKQQGCKKPKIKLVPLCNSCHGRTQKDRKHWEEHLEFMSNLYKIKDTMSSWGN